MKTTGGQTFVKLDNTEVRQGNTRLVLPGWTREDLINFSIPSRAGVFEDTALQLYPIGTKLVMDGKTYKYSLAAAAMTARGFLKYHNLQCPGKAGNSAHSGYEAALYAAIVAGQNYFDITDTAAYKNEYEGAHAVFYDDTTAIYDDYTVIGNDVSDGTFTRLYIPEPGFLGVHAAAVQATVYINRYRSVTGTANAYKSALGWAKFSVASGYYFWLQTAGIISGITGASTWPGQTGYQRDVYCNTDGSLIGITSTTYLYQRVGYLLCGTASDYGDNLIMLQLDDSDPS